MAKRAAKAGRGRADAENPAKSGRPLVVTTALPYANGPLHLGFMLEAVQADIFVRFQRLKGREVLFMGADDTHGTPIQINAEKEGIAPEEFIRRYYEQHVQDVRDFRISFDNYHSTHSEENRELSNRIFGKLKENSHIYTKEVELTYCEKDSRFLPDRYVKGRCPKCNAPDQYGDVCEACNSTYKPTDLAEPYCTLCRQPPVRRSSMHYFFRLSAFSGQLEKWLSSNRNLQPEILNFIRSWLREGLQDWDISRDEPYFGFPIPGEKSKYYYVWFDAPIGYFASLANYCRGRGLDFEKYMGEDAELVHFIGKDIIYHHFLFWPAMLMGSGFRLPSLIHVHGFLTMGREKMSKSRGTLLTAREYLRLYPNPELLRFYYAGNLTRKVADVNMDFDDFRERVNSELVGNIANFAYRVLSFAAAHLDSSLGKLPRGEREKRLIADAEARLKEVEAAYESLEFREAVRKILEVSDLGNRYFQESEPWQLIKEDRQRCAEVVTLSANIVRNLAIALAPITPSFSEQLKSQLGLESLAWEDLGFGLESSRLGKAAIVLSKMESPEGTQEEQGKAEGAVEPLLDLRIGVVEEVKNHPNADKLYVLKVNLGDETRQLVAGMRPHYRPEELLGRKIVVLCNLEHAKLRGEESQGMLLAADDGSRVRILSAEKSAPGDPVFASEARATPGGGKISMKEFQTVKLTTRGGQVLQGGAALRTEKEFIRADIGDGAVVR